VITYAIFRTFEEERGFGWQNGGLTKEGARGGARGARKIQEHLGEGVRRTLEETLNAMLDAEADRLCRAERYERTEARKDTRACSYQRRLQTKAGEVTLKVLREPPLGSERSGMNAPTKTFGSPSGKPSTTRLMPQQMCEKLWTLPVWWAPG